MERLVLSNKGIQLIEMYKQMAKEGYDTRRGDRVDDAFRDFELRYYRSKLRQILNEYSIATVLDYGCGGSDWETSGFDKSGRSAKEYFKLENAYQYEPARNIDERQKVDCVISFDVLEHIFIADVPLVLRDMFSCAKKLLVLNVACYPAAAKLPNGDNAHVTVRSPAWWKGMLDCISVEYPKVNILLICSKSWRNSSAVPIWQADNWQHNNSFITY